MRALRSIPLATAVFIALPALAFAADPLKPSAVVGSPSTYEGKTVTVAGTVSNFQTANSPMGTVSFFQLCDPKCVVVIDSTKPTYKNGDQQTATGTFHSTFKAPRRTFSNVVLVK
jgi:hypothetical protein